MYKREKSAQIHFHTKRPLAITKYTYIHVHVGTKVALGLYFYDYH